MKYLFILILPLLLSSKTFAQAVIEFKQTDYELKDLKADDQPFTQTISFKNKGKSPVIISRVAPMTNIIQTDWTKEPIAPGKTGEIRLTFTPARLQEKFTYSVLVYSNASNNRTQLKLSGNLVDNPEKPYLLYKYDISGLKFKVTNINLNKVFTWEVKTDTFYFYNLRQEPINMSIQYKPRYINASFIPEKVEPGQKGCLIVTYDAPQKNDYGYDYASVIFRINNEDGYQNRITVSANIVEDFSKLSKKELTEAPGATFDTKEIKFGNIKPGEKKNCDFTLTNSGKSNLLIRKTKASCGCTAITLGEKTIEPGKSTTIRATFDSTGKSGRQIKSITVITNDPQNPETILTIDGNITN